MRIKRSLLAVFVVTLLVASLFGTVTGIGVGLEEEDVGEATLSGRSVAEDPIEIYDWHDLDDARNDLSADYILMNDLEEDTDGYDEYVSENAITNATQKFGSWGGDSSGTTFELQTSPIEEIIYVKDTYDDSEISYEADLSEGNVTIQENTGSKTEIRYMAEGLGWKQIGDFDLNEDVEFNGTFDGNGYEIRGLYINRTDEDNVGLFRATGNGAEITNLGVVDADVSGEHHVGGSSDGTLARY